MTLQPIPHRIGLAIIGALVLLVSGCSSGESAPTETSFTESAGGISAGGDIGGDPSIANSDDGAESEAEVEVEVDEPEAKSGPVPGFAIDFGECTVTEDGITLLATNTGTETSGFNVEVDFLDPSGAVLGTHTTGTQALRPNEQTRLTNLTTSFRYGADSDTPATNCQPREARESDASVTQSGTSELDEGTFTCRHADTDGFGEIVGELIAPPSSHDTTVQVTIAWIVGDLRIATSFYNVPVGPAGVIAPLSTFIEAPTEPVVCEVVEARQHG